MSHARNKRERQEAIELKLMTSRLGYRPGELAAHFNVNRATIHRDLEEISQRVNLIQEDAGRYRIPATEYIREVRLSNAEALTIYLALRRFIRQTSHAPAFFGTAIRKITVALHHSSLAEQLGESTEVLDTQRQASRDQTEVWNRLLQGWYESVVVKLEYRKGRQTQIETHDFKPYLFEPAVLSHGTYVIGWSRTRGQLRTFKVDRIQRVSLTAQFFTPNQDVTAVDLLRHAWGVWYGVDLTKVVLRFAPEVAARVRETIWHPSQVLEEQPDGSLLWSVEIAGTLELVSWIRGWGHEVEVLAPESLRAEIADSLRKAAALYEK
ncbi:WYL domain-containing protein [Anaerolineae bacterium CFX9]|nr:WYL domain-containing protein [Anaerolineae bacterium CFX9]